MVADRKRLILFILVALFALVAGFVTFPADQAPLIVLYLGPWAMFATVVAFGTALVRLARDSWPDLQTATHSRAWWGEVALIALCTVIALVHDPRGFKILSDELVLMGTSYDLHFDRQFLVPLRAHDVAGNLAQIGGVVDKRPFFFAYVLSLLHDLTGYRPANVFVLNGIATALMLSFTCALGRQLAGRWGGVLALLLLTAVPLVAQNATGGGFEVFNVMMIAGVMLLANRYLHRRDDASLNALVLGGVLLAQTRYESVLFVLPVGALIAGAWWRQRRLQLTWTVLAAPLALVMYPLQNKVFQKNPAFWQLPDNVAHPFGLEFLSRNVGHALNFLFSLTGDLPNSPVVAGLGLLAIGLFLPFALRKRAAVCRERPEVLVVGAFGLVIVANVAVLMCYHWGQLDRFEVWRLSLPLHLLMVLAIATVLRDFSPHPRVVPVACALAGVLIYAHAIPTMARSVATRSATVTNETAWEIEFLRKHAGEEMLFITNAPMLPIVHQVPGISINAANESPARIAYHLRFRTYGVIYAFQRCELDPQTAAVKPAKYFALHDAFVTEVVQEHSFYPFTVVRILRITGVRSPEEIAATNPAGATPLPATVIHTPEDTDTMPPPAAMKEYFDALP